MKCGQFRDEVSTSSLAGTALQTAGVTSSGANIERESLSLGGKSLSRGGPFVNNKSYLVDPASNICLSQRLSHACLSINNFIL